MVAYRRIPRSSKLFPNQMWSRSRWARSTSNCCCNNRPTGVIFRTRRLATERRWCSLHTLSTRPRKMYRKCRNICCCGTSSKLTRHLSWLVRKMGTFRGSLPFIAIICRFRMVMVSLKWKFFRGPSQLSHRQSISLSKSSNSSSKKK